MRLVVLRDPELLIVHIFLDTKKWDILLQLKYQRLLLSELLAQVSMKIDYLGSLDVLG